MYGMQRQCRESWFDTQVQGQEDSVWYAYLPCKKPKGQSVSTKAPFYIAMARCEGMSAGHECVGFSLGALVSHTQSLLTIHSCVWASRAWFTRL